MKKRMTTLVVLAGALSLSACVNLKNQTASNIRCDSSNIEISHYSVSIDRSTWFASCNNLRYICSTLYDEQENAITKCSPTAQF